MSAPRRKNKDPLRAVEDSQSAAIEPLADIHCAAIVDHMSDALIISDDTGHIRYSNRATQAIFGYSNEELIGKDLRVLLPEPYYSHPDGLKRYAADYEANVFQKGEFTRRADGAEIPIERRIDRVVIDGKLHSMHVIRDVTLRRKLEHMGNEFLAAAAHELRSPMASIYGFSELLLQRRFSEARQTELLEIIYNQASHMTRLINELLDLARIEARGERAFNMKRQPVEPIVRATVAGFLIPSQRAAIHVTCEPDLPQVNADTDKMQQALTNILSNAYKYSPAGGPVELQVRADAQRERVLITIADRGIGMPEGVSARVFERFYRGDDAAAIRGTGLGMTLVKEIFDHHGGHVEVESRAGKGTRVTLVLPIARGA
jgi:PAS domain S-box-containing protein